MNKYTLLINIGSGKHDLRPLAAMSEALDLVKRMIDGEKEKRPTVAELLRWHPYFWDDSKRFAFLCAVGNTDEVAKGGKDAESILPSSVLGAVVGKGRGGGWKQALDAVVVEEYTSSSKHRTHYDPRSLPHLLRFMRNAHQHRHHDDDGAGAGAGASASTSTSAAARAAFVADGGIAPYFLSRFPSLLMAVWQAVGRAGWAARAELRDYLPAETAAASQPPTTPTVAAALPSAPAAPAPGPGPVREWSLAQVGRWLGSVGSAFSQYADSFAATGIDGEELLDLNSDELVELGISSALHRKRILKEISKLKLRPSGGRATAE